MSGSRSATIGVGVVGCGRIALYAHIPLLRHLRGASLVAVADPEVSAWARAQRLARVAVHKDARELLNREDVHAVVICAPTPVHAELALAAAAAGKHFYLEKPIATNAADGRRVVEAVVWSGVEAALGFNRRLHPLFERAREILREGRIGRVRAVQTAFCERVPPEDMPAWKRARATGGGVLLDLASHHVDTVRWLLSDEIAEVEGSLWSELSEHDSARLRLSMEGGAEVQGFFSYRAEYADFLEILGERGTLRVDRHRSALELRVGRRHGYGSRRAWVAPTRAVMKWRLERPLRRVRELSFRRSLEAFVAQIQGGPRRLASAEDGLRNLEVLLAAEASAQRESILLASS